MEHGFRQRRAGQRAPSEVPDGRRRLYPRVRRHRDRPRHQRRLRRARFRGYPRAVRTDNRLEFTSRASIAWTQQHGIQHLLIEPGRPTRNGYIESFNGKFRDECLHKHWFTSLAQSRDVIAEWRRDYNQV